jgi:hypothetical protein
MEIKRFDRFLSESVISVDLMDFEKDLKGLLDREKTIDDFRKVCSDHNIILKMGDEFYSKLTPEEKRNAPPQFAPLFATLDKETNKAILVVNNRDMEKNMKGSVSNFVHYNFNEIMKAMRHEHVHVGQVSRKGGRWDSSNGVSDEKSYFSNKDEVMAFARTVSDEVMSQKPKSLEIAVGMIRRSGTWNRISKIVDENTRNRYKKYVYSYLEKDFEK